jgi:peroxiredoxin (alkyl hydroperoxide reductase subunit C)
MNILIGRQAPLFTAKAVNGKNEIFDFCLESFLNKSSTKGVLLFFYPLNFTFVCPTELVKLNEYLSEFEQRGIVVCTVSVDSEYSHLAWKNKSVSEGGIGDVGFNMISDLSHEISLKYGLLSENGRVSYRGTIFIDENGLVRHVSINDLMIGRNIDEIIRIIDAFKFFEKNGDVCPANWKPGDSGMEPSLRGVQDYMTSNCHDND